MRCFSFRYFAAAVVAIATSGWFSDAASAVEGTEVNGSLGVWAPLLPDFQAGGVTDSGDSVGGIVGLSALHRFDGYRTSVEGGVKYGFADSVEMLGVDALLRDTWTFGIGDLSAGGGFSYMDWQQDLGSHELNSEYVGGKIIGGWETAFGRRPIWIDLSLGLYDLSGEYVGDDGNVVTTASISEFTTTYGIDIKTDFMMLNTPARAFFGINYLEDITTWQAGQIGTDSAVVLQAGIELRLF